MTPPTDEFHSQKEAPKEDQKNLVSDELFSPKKTKAKKVTLPSS